MKLRRDFVTNSSSSSFVMIGVNFGYGTDARKKLCEALGLKNDISEDGIVDDDAYDENLTKLEEIGLAIAANEDNEKLGGVMFLSWANDDPQYKVFDISVVEGAIKRMIDLGFKREEIKLFAGEVYPG